MKNENWKVFNKDNGIFYTIIDINYNDGIAHGVAYGDWEEFEVDDILKPIMKDINDNLIYPYSSIFEFYYGGTKSYEKGSFVFSDEELRYKIKVYGYGIINYNKSKTFKLKVVDTIQENKLNLVDIK